MEFLWQVDEKDEPIGKVERGKAHEEGILHRAGVVFLVKDKQVYITRRAQSKRIFPDLFDASAAFHVEFGESYEEAAVREAKEELGLELKVRFIGKARNHFEVDRPEEQWIGVFVAEYSGGEIQLDASESSGGRFVSIEEVGKLVDEEKVTPWMREGWKVFQKGL